MTRACWPQALALNTALTGALEAAARECPSCVRKELATMSRRDPASHS
jgi:hypothetical protein